LRKSAAILQNRGVKGILIACVDGLKGFPDAINAVYPETQIQLCIVHIVRNSVKYVPRKDYKAVTADLKKMYQATTEESALASLESFSEKWDDKYPQISKSWRQHWENLITPFKHPADIRKATKKRKVFPTDDSAKKVINLATGQASEKLTMPIRNWKPALNRFMIEFEDRVKDYT